VLTCWFVPCWLQVQGEGGAGHVGVCHLYEAVLSPTHAALVLEYAAGKWDPLGGGGGQPLIGSTFVIRVGIRGIHQHGVTDKSQPQTFPTRQRLEQRPVKRCQQWGATRRGFDASMASCTAGGTLYHYVESRALLTTRLHELCVPEETARYLFKVGTQCLLSKHVTCTGS
jgi:hypothetical protein